MNANREKFVTFFNTHANYANQMNSFYKVQRFKIVNRIWT